MGAEIARCGAPLKGEVHNSPGFAIFLFPLAAGIPSMGTGKAGEQTMTGAESGREPGQASNTLREVASDIAGLPLGQQIVRTLVDTVVFTPRVAHDIVDGTQAYFSPLRLFLSLMGALIALTAFLGLPTLFSLDGLLIPAAQERLDPFLADNNTTRLALVTTLDRWSGLLSWPVMTIAALPYILILKAFRPSIGWWQHAQIYLIANNVMLIATLAVMPTLLAGEGVFLVATTLTVVLFFVALARIGASAYALKWPAVAGLTAANIAISIPSIGLYLVLALFSIHIVLELSFGISLLDVLALNLETTTAADTTGD